MMARWRLQFLLLVLFALLTPLVACTSPSVSGQQPEGETSVQPPNPVTTSPNAGGESVPSGETTSDDPMRGLQVKQEVTLTLPEIGQAPARIVKKDRTVFGVVVQIGGQWVMMHEPVPKNGKLIGPYDGTITLSTKDLDQDGRMEVLLEGPAGIGPGIWVYQFENSAKSFRFLGALYGEKGIVQSAAEDGTVRFKVDSRDYTAPGQPVVSRYWKWNSSGFYEVGK